jgi:hypothetical protein
MANVRLKVAALSSRGLRALRSPDSLEALAIRKPARASREELSLRLVALGLAGAQAQRFAVSSS